ncbi:polysaccharide deacetylase family protein [Streptomyces sp. NPDC001275]
MTTSPTTSTMTTPLTRAKPDGQPHRLGMLTPSSNTCLEPVTYRLLGITGADAGVTAHFARVPVTRIALDDGCDAQFDTAPMLAAARQLADAKVDVIAWNGTSGSWLGVDRDRALCAAITEAIGVPATTSIGAHGYSHENPIAMTPQQEEDVLAKCVELIEQYTGRKPRGYVAPWWEMSPYTAELLHKYGFSYDHSQNYRDFTPFYARVGDQWTKIDYTAEAKDWMKPLIHGHEVDLVEFCGNWYVDDLPPMMFNKHAHNSHGYVSPRVLEQDWKDQFDWVHRELDYAVLPITLHPDVSGRPQVLLMLERFIDYVSGHDGVSFCTLEDAADDFRRRFPFDGPDRPTDMR